MWLYTNGRWLEPPTGAEAIDDRMENDCQRGNDNVVVVVFNPSQKKSPRVTTDTHTQEKWLEKRNPKAEFNDHRQSIELLPSQEKKKSPILLVVEH